MEGTKRRAANSLGMFDLLKGVGMLTIVFAHTGAQRQAAVVEIVGLHGHLSLIHISLCLFRIVWIQFALPLFAGIEGVLLVYPVSWAVGAVLMVLYAWKGKWMQLPEAIS